MEYRAIKVRKNIYDDLKELKKVLIKEGLNSLPEQITSKLEPNISLGSIIALGILGIRYLLENE